MAKTTRKLRLKSETLRRLDRLTRDQLDRVVGGSYLPVDPYVPDYPEVDSYTTPIYRLSGGNSRDSRCG